MTGSLRWRVLVVLGLAAVIPTVIVGALAIARARGDLAGEVRRGALAHIRALGAGLDGTLQDARRTVELAAATWADAPDDAAATDRLLRRLRREVPIVQALAILGPDGELRRGDPAAVPTAPAPAALGDVLGAHSFGGYVGDAIFVDGRPVVPLVVQARGRTGELMGVVVARLDLGFVQDAIRQARLGPGARVVVVDGAGVPVARSDAATGAPTSLAGRDPAVDAALASSVEGTLTADGWVSAYRNLSSYQSVRGVRWAIVHQQPVDEAYALARRATRDLLIIGGAALALALTLGFFFASRLTGPLAALARRADAIAAGIAAPHGGGAAEVVIADLGPPVTGPGEIGVLASRLDEMARRIAERSELATALARGDRLASVGVMSAQVAHEINNPLTTVLGYAQLLLEDKPADHPDRAALELIAEEAQRMKGIVGGMLDYARTPRDDDARRADPAQVLGHVAALLEPQLRRARATLRTELTTTAAIAIEGHALQQVLVNLVQNALQAQDGVVVTVRARPAPGGLATQLVVADDGPGIPAADRARVFDPFFTTKAAGVGTGLGLAVCRHLVATAGGTIEVGAGPDGRGAEFRLVIPNAS